MLQGGSHGHHFLHKADFHGLPQIDRAGACDLHLHEKLPQLLVGAAQQLRQSLLRVGVMASVFAENDFVVFVKQNQFYGCGTNVNAGPVCFHNITLFRSFFVSKGYFVDFDLDFCIIWGNPKKSKK